MVSIAARNSAIPTEYQIPSEPIISGKINNAATSKTNVRKNAINAEVKPSPKLVNREDP